MRELLRFEFRRNIKYIIVFISLIAVIGTVLNAINTDTEELVITLSILLFILPYSVIASSLVKSLMQDTGGKTRHLYLSLPKRRVQIIRAKLLYAFICFAFYFALVMLVPNQFIFIDKLFSMLLFAVIFGLVLQLTALLILFKKNTIR